jgi:hypothetical protein
MLAAAVSARAEGGVPSAAALSSYCVAKTAFGQPLGEPGLKGRSLVPGAFQNWSDPARTYRPFDHFSATLTEKTRRLIGIDATRGYHDLGEAKATYGALVQALRGAGMSEKPAPADQAVLPNTETATFVLKDAPDAVEIEVSASYGSAEALLEMNCRSPAVFPDAVKEWIATP